MKKFSIPIMLIIVALIFTGCYIQNTNSSWLQPTKEKIVLTTDNVKEYLDITTSLTNVKSSHSTVFSLYNCYEFSGDLSVEIKPLSSDYIYEQKTVYLEVTIGNSIEPHMVTINLDENGCGSYRNNISESNIIPMTSYDSYYRIRGVE